MKIPFYRYILLLLVFVGVCSFYVYLGVKAVGSFDGGSLGDDDGLTVTYETIYAVRGEIYDRNGVPLVKNEKAHSLVLEYGAMPDTKREINDMFLYADYVVKLYGNKDDIPVLLSPFKGMYPNITYDPEKISNKTIESNLKYIRRIYGIKESDAETVIKTLIRYYGLLATDEAGNRIYSDDEVTLLLSLRYDCEAKKFGPDEPYVFCRNISDSMILDVNEKKMQGLNIAVECNRTYPYDGIATHLLGRIGKITAEEWEYYKEQGYRIDETVGVSGVEKAFEARLRGVNGKMKVVRDSSGAIVKTEIAVEPKKGNDVYLTIDIEVQTAAERSLVEAIEYIRKNAVPTAESQNGADASAGSAVVMDPETFEILAIASYPTYTMEEFENNYASLVKNEAKPLIFRAVDGLYAPGSTFKVGMALAGLESGTITLGTTIDTTRGAHIKNGKYMYYRDYQPTCWINNMYGSSHGKINVSEAIRDSCNCFFFEIGRLMGIETMNNYSQLLGFGKSTGIEIGEKTGILAGPTYREDNDLLAWSGGDTIAAAIGQSDNLFTPLQLCSYISTVMNGGKRYDAHVLSAIKNYGSTTALETHVPKLLSSVEISEGTLNAIKIGMRAVLTETANVRRHFKDCPVEAIVKTGTAELGGNRSHNATMIGYGENEEKGSITVSVVIEQGHSGAHCGIVVNEVMKSYFGTKE